VRLAKENDDAIWTVSRFGDIAGDFVGWRVCVFPRRRISDSFAADFRRDLSDHSLVLGQRQDRLKIDAA
jgi:hypothetical protein